ncbi:activator of basal transcription 1-like [Mercenaria mercenaria]|uniref:activator of basal transcription 1-like n=1 Tax=Mercenaria mercenaria TaxID=6596 RepID=UPI00234E648B|nr:activator of basal transcription 1-like [Mercenaria mercenaria]
MEDNVPVNSIKETKKKKKPVQSGIIYLSRVPTLMNVNIVRRYFENFGELGRVFLQPDVKAKTRGKRGRAFSEGWLEFRDKRVAKKVATSLNNTQIGGKKKNKWREELWNIKYLHRFKWAHLNERLAYEKAVHAQRMRAEISQAKREANFHIQNAEKNERQKFIEKKQRKRKEAKVLESEGNETLNEDKNINERVNVIRLKETDDEIRNKRKLKNKTVLEGAKKQKLVSDGEKVKDLGKRKAFLSKIFSAGFDANSDED